MALIKFVVLLSSFIYHLEKKCHSCPFPPLPAPLQRGGRRGQRPLRTKRLPRSCYCPGSLLLALPACLNIFEWKMGISSPTKEEATSSGHLFLAVFPIHLTCWWGQVHVVLSEGVWERNELPTIARLKIKVSWVWMAFLCWVGGFYCSYSYIVSTILGSQNTLLSSKHISHFSFSCLMPHFQGLYLYLAAGSEKNRSTPSYPVWT